MKRFLYVSALLLLVSPALAQADDLTSFSPRPDAVFIQQEAGFPDLGNTRVVLALGSDEVERLKATTGRSDLIAVGGHGHHVVFRDDGEFGDSAKEDGHFTAIADIDPADLAERSVVNRTNETEGENVVPVFDGRAIVGHEEATPFDFEAFLSGQLVRVERSLSVSRAGSVREGASGDGVRSTSAPVVIPGTNQFQDRVLMITDPAVVTDPLRTFNPCGSVGTPMGAWTFGHLMTEMANQSATGINPSTFVETWLAHWLANQPINGFNVPDRNVAITALLKDWHEASAGNDLDLSIAPFRLLAINPRVDLRTTTGGTGGYGGSASGLFLDGGEARFTFGVILPKGYPRSKAVFNFNVPVGTLPCQVTRFSVILEYRVPKCECEDVRDWARSWIELDSFVPGTNDYNARLERLTRTFTDAGANPARSNRSAIGQVRSNEIALQIPWEIREFQLRMMPWSYLLETTTADSPDDSFNNTVTFANFLFDVIAGTAGPPIPLQYPLGTPNPFLGANPQTPNPATTFWRAPGFNPPGTPIEDATRHAASLGTCNGCHARETDTIFQHIESFQPVPPAVLSGFLTGITVVDPAGSGTIREFDDLERREADINAVALTICSRIRPILHGPILPGPVGPLRSDGHEVMSMSAASVEPDPAAKTMSVPIDEFLREPVRQVH